MKEVGDIKKILAEQAAGISEVRKSFIEHDSILLQLSRAVEGLGKTITATTGALAEQHVKVVDSIFSANKDVVA
eukprot:3153900-Karenia_brevis.AAC.1